MISIVSAYFNRKRLLINTLDSLSKSVISEFEFIVVDDCSDEDNRIEDLCETYPFLKVIRINLSEKWYVNPCIPFNIGFKETKGDIILIQNPECFHYDDILSYVNNNLKENDYLSFSCYALSKEKTEVLQESLLQDNLIIDKSVREDISGDEGWYNHSVYRPVGYHFCSAIHKSKLNELGGFDERYANGVTHDDNEFLVRIKRMGLNFKIIDSVKVLHQWHPSFNYNLENLTELITINTNLFYNKTLKEKIYKANFVKIVEEIIMDPKRVLHEWINEKTTNSKIVVELGAGFFGCLAYVNKNTEKKIGIEIWEPYIQNSIYDDCIKIHGNIFDYEILLSESDYDTVMIIDVLEHFEKEESIKLIESLKKRFRKVLLMIPEGNHPQEEDVTGFGAHEFQTHKSTWIFSEISEILGFDDVIYYKNFHSQAGKDPGCVFASWERDNIVCVVNDENKIKENINVNKKVLICGGAGYIGGLTCDYLVRDGFEVTVYDNLLYENRFLKEIPFIYGDIRDTKKLHKTSKDFDVIILMAALVGDPACSIDNELTEKINYQAIKNFCDVVDDDKHLIFISTCSVYGVQDGILNEESPTNPLSSYASTKLKAEKCILEKNGTVFRLGTVFGLGDTYSRLRMDLVVNVLTMKAIKYGEININGGKQWRPIIAVKDIAEYIVEAVKFKYLGVYILSKENILIKELGEKIVNIIPNTKINYTEILFQDIRNYRVDNSKSLATFKYKPCISVEEEVYRMVEIFKEERIQNPEDNIYHNGFFIKNKKEKNEFI